MNYSMLSQFQWICLDANILETMSRKTWEKKICLVCVDMALEESARHSEMRIATLKIT